MGQTSAPDLLDRISRAMRLAADRFDLAVGSRGGKTVIISKINDSYVGFCAVIESNRYEHQKYSIALWHGSIDSNIMLTDLLMPDDDPDEVLCEMSCFRYASELEVAMFDLLSDYFSIKHNYSIY